MKKFLLLLVLALPLTALTQTQETVAAKPVTAIIKTNKGDITLNLYADKAPVTVNNFVQYAQSGFYDGTIFHRVIQRFMIQGGGFTKTMEKKPTREPIINESGNGLYNDRWTVAMARTADPDSATSQFFINVRMNSNLNATRGNPGYAVFGEVVDGQHVVQAIEKVVTHTVGGYENVPVEPIVIETIEIKP